MSRRLIPAGLPEQLQGLERTAVMTVLNVTPDSFSDGGRFLDVDAAVERAIHQVALGADLVDVGGESTRPGAERVAVETELDRVLPVVSSLSEAGIVVSIDTMRAQVAKEAVAAGATIVNDVSGGLADEAMLGFVSGAGVPVILMHWRGHSRTMQQNAVYETGVVKEVLVELSERKAAAIAAGVDPERIVLDPGLGFAKESEHNWELLASLDELATLGQPLLLGASRKRFLGSLLNEQGNPRPVMERDDATLAVTALAAAAGVWCVRVHDARGNTDAVRVASAWVEAKP
jgi:dihydropteroate synthase